MQKNTSGEANIIEMFNVVKRFEESMLKLNQHIANAMAAEARARVHNANASKIIKGEL